MTDPFTQLIAGAQAILQKNATLRKVMGAAIKNFGGSYDVNTEADVPRIILEPVGGPANINAASGYVTMDYSINLLIDSGHEDLAKVLNPILWAVFCIIVSALSTSSLTALRWRDAAFVKSFRITAAGVGTLNPQMQTGMRGMTAVCVLTFNLGFNKPDLAAYAEGN